MRLNILIVLKTQILPRHDPSQENPEMKLTQQQLENHLWGAANILRGKTAGQDYKNYILSLMFYKRLCDQWENEADEAIAELERQQSRTFTDAQKAVFRARGEHRYTIPEGSRWGDVLAASTSLGQILILTCIQDDIFVGCGHGGESHGQNGKDWC